MILIKFRKFRITLFIILALGQVPSYCELEEFKLNYCLLYCVSKEVKILL